MAEADRGVSAGAVDIATRDFGGPGTPLLLLHGAGANLATMDAFAREPAARFRVVTLDLRGHGRSGDGPWEWPAVLGDIEAVADRLELGEPAVVGWSLGGMVAALWAERHPGCPMAGSVDGTPPPARPEQLDGLEPVRANAALRVVRVEGASHAMVAERPAELAELITDFADAYS